MEWINNKKCECSIASLSTTFHLNANGIEIYTCFCIRSSWWLAINCFSQATFFSLNESVTMMLSSLSIVEPVRVIAVELPARPIQICEEETNCAYWLLHNVVFYVDKIIKLVGLLQLTTSSCTSVMTKASRLESMFPKITSFYLRIGVCDISQACRQ